MTRVNNLSLEELSIDSPMAMEMLVKPQVRWQTCCNQSPTGSSTLLVGK